VNGLEQRLAAIVERVSDGDVPAREAVLPQASLRALGLSSLGFLRLFDALEQEFDVELDGDTDPGHLDRIDLIAARLHTLGVPARRP
jgi:acyl carrier protein